MTSLRLHNNTTHINPFLSLAKPNDSNGQFAQQYQSYGLKCTQEKFESNPSDANI